MDRLDLISPDSDLKATVKTLLTNSKVTQQGIDLLGVNLLKAIQVSTSQAVTSTSYVPVDGFQSSVRTSGGLVLYAATLAVSITGQTGLVQLLVDDLPVFTKCFGDSGVGLGEIVILWFGALNAGQHTFKLNAKVDGGTLTFSQAIAGTCDAYIVEFLKG